MHWERKLVDMDDFHRFRNELNLSFDAAEDVNGI